MTELRTRKHLLRERIIIEIWEHGEMLGTICPCNGGVNVVSERFAGRSLEDSAQFATDSKLSIAAGVPVLVVRVAKARGETHA